MPVTAVRVDPVEVLGRFAARADAEHMTYMPLTVCGLTEGEMATLVTLRLAEADKRGAYRLTARGAEAAAELAGPGAFDLAARLATARGVAGGSAASADVARTAVLLTTDDELRPALRAALAELLSARASGSVGAAMPSPADRAKSSAGASSPKPSRWENLSDVLSSQRVVVSTGAGRSKVLALCTPSDLRQASTYYAASADEALRRSGACTALADLMALYEAETVADLERVAPQKFSEVWS